MQHYFDGLMVNYGISNTIVLIQHYIAGLVVNYGISNTTVLEIP